MGVNNKFVKIKNRKAVLTERGKAFLEENYKKRGVAFICDLFEIAPSTLKTITSNMGWHKRGNMPYVSMEGRKCIITEEGKKWLIEYYGCTDTKTITEVLGVRDTTWYRWVIELGLKKEQEYMDGIAARRKKGMLKYWRTLSDEERKMYSEKNAERLARARASQQMNIGELYKWKKEHDPEGYRAMVDKRNEVCKKLRESDEYREAWGLERRTRYRFKSRMSEEKIKRVYDMRHRLKKKGWCVGSCSMAVEWCEGAMKVPKRMKDNAQKLGFIFRE